ncbi:MAG TPA: membrane dipeptidase [Ktedonobacterales bacterium]
MDAHEDIAFNALHGDRDVRRSTAEQRAREARQPTTGSDSPVTNLDDTVMIGLPDLKRGGVGLVCSTIFTLPGEQNIVTADAWSQARYYHDLAAGTDVTGVRLISTRSDLESLTRDFDAATTPDARPTGFLLLMEGADPIREPAELEQWYDAGLRVIGPTWRGSRYCGGTGSPGGFTDIGRALLDEMARLGMVLDFSHMADDAVWEALERYPGPIIASHTNCRKYTPTDRHFTDEQIKAIIARDGVIGVVLHNSFLDPQWTRGAPPLQLDVVVRHLDRVCQLAGDARHSGIGSDFDGGAGVQSTPAPFDTVADLARIADALRDHGYTSADITGIMGGNFVRAFTSALPAEGAKQR